MANGLVTASKGYPEVKVLSSRVSELRLEIGALGRITKKLLEGRPLSEDERDTLTLLAAREEQKVGWIAWDKFKKQLK